jgi:hypothetical protein
MGTPFQQRDGDTLQNLSKLSGEECPQSDGKSVPNLKIKGGVI